MFLTIAAVGISCGGNEGGDGKGGQNGTLNDEADILTCEVNGGNSILLSAPVIENEAISLSPKAGTDVTAIALNFTLSDGATISPASGTILDFSKPQTYTVTSEDGKGTKTYTVTFYTISEEGISTTYGFDNISYKEGSNYKYTVFNELNKEGNVAMTWASGNAGFNIVNKNTDPTTYPTSQSEDGRTDKCLKLVTKSTGTLGATFGMPIAAGNIFLGTFDATSASSKPLQATKFGVLFKNKPVRLKGYYKYTPVDIAAGNPDAFSVYSVLFSTDGGVNNLDGTNVFTHKNVIAVAKYENDQNASAWTEFNIPFKYNGQTEFSQADLDAGKYKLALVFSSSAAGDEFKGGIGSTLLIDDVEIVCE